jgi:glucosamine 6-phosphate synthetase-like amidotransferase/phosphosugar isomerase protein
MCGLFGLLRCPDAGHREEASAAFVLLGVLAEERGRDSAGVALLSGRHRDSSPAPAGITRFGNVQVGRCRVVKARGRFSRLWRPDLDHGLDRARVALGHTRWATQGGTGLANASPMLAGTLACTHNGDVDAAALRARFSLPAGFGGTDSEAIFQALAAARDADATVTVLGSIAGRAALAWADRAAPGRVHLARAALSPLVVAPDTKGNVWWASNPQWLRVVERETPVRFARKVLLAEGTYAVVRAGSPPRLVLCRRFVPMARPEDIRAQAGVWRGFTAADRRIAQQPGLRRHVVRRPGGRSPGAAA